MEMHFGDDVAETLTALAELADMLGEDRGPGTAALLLRVDRTDDPEACDLAVCEVQSAPADVLRGYVAPEETEFLGVVAHGWAAPLPDGDAPMTAPSRHPKRERVRVTTVLARSGEVAGILRRGGGTVMAEAPSAGAVLDALRQAFSLPPSPS